MSDDRGKGWWREPRRHRRAAIKGWEGRRKKKAKIRELRKQDFKDRSERARAIDRGIMAETVYDPEDPEQVKKWKASKNTTDLAGVDTLMELTEVKKKAQEEVQECKENTDKIVDNAKEDVEEIEGNDDLSEEEKEEKQKETLEKAKEEVKKEAEEAQKDVQKAEEEQKEIISRARDKWSKLRKKQANSVADTVGCTNFEADALIQRAKRAGHSYDEVDWDQLQGEDLEYGERVDKLDRQLHTTTMTKGQIEQIDRQVDYVLDGLEEEPELYRKQAVGVFNDLAAQYHAGTL